MSVWKHYTLDLYKRQNKTYINQDRGEPIIAWFASEYNDRLTHALQDIAAKSDIFQGYLYFMEGDECDISLDSLCNYISEQVLNWDSLCNDLCQLSAAIPELLFEVEVHYDDNEYSDWRVIARNGEYWTVDAIRYFPPYDKIPDGKVVDGSVVDV